VRAPAERPAVSQRKTMNSDSLNGVLLVDKGPDMTSHDVVAVARRALNTKKIGHCGTLDPMATGLLILVIGKATKIQDLLMSEDKEYTGTLSLGKTTNTQDAEGEVTEEREVPPLTDEEVVAAFEKYKGDFYQTPPMVSAIKMDGVPLYKLARQGKVVEREPRFVHVYSYRIDGIRLPEVDFTVKCSKGFYVRTYAHDIGGTLGCGAHLKSLRRTRSGKFDLTRSVTFEDLKHGDSREVIAKMLSLPEVSRLRGA
jgi:tRNA pseudouridine55 synthase